MYAILIEDAIAEKTSVMSTLAADSIAAMILMLTTAENWIATQQVDLGYTLCQHDHLHCVTVTCGPSIVLTVTAQSIDSVISSSELRAFTDPRGSN